MKRYLAATIFFWINIISITYFYTILTKLFIIRILEQIYCIQKNIKGVHFYTPLYDNDHETLETGHAMSLLRLQFAVTKYIVENT